MKSGMDKARAASFAKVFVGRLITEPDRFNSSAASLVDSILAMPFPDVPTIPPVVPIASGGCVWSEADTLTTRPMSDAIC